MEIQAPTHQKMTRLLRDTLNIVLAQVGRALSKTSKIIMIDLEFLLKRGNSMCGKAIKKLLALRSSHLTAATALSCLPSDADNYLSSFISPRDYHFSCSSSPISQRRSKHRHNYNHRYVSQQNYSQHYYSRASAVQAVDKALDSLNKRKVMGNESPEVDLPGFGRSPVARQLRVTDSPFSLREGGLGDQRSEKVDKAAEEFINRFYMELKMQRKIAPAPACVSYYVESGYKRTLPEVSSFSYVSKNGLGSFNCQ